jgi:hypothetical protein
VSESRFVDVLAGARTGAAFSARAVVLVEGISDQRALEALAERRGRNLDAEGLEDELIRALGASLVEDVVEGQGDLGSFRTLQKQPAWQGRSVEEQLRRFMGSGGSRKIRYARLLVDTLDLTQVPRPLDGVLAHV